jgi:ribosome maturation factor RimP
LSPQLRIRHSGWGLKMKTSGLPQKQTLEARITEMAEEVASSMGMEVVLIEIKGSGKHSTVRTFIDQPGGISLDDCERFSRRFSVVLDVEDWIPFSYTLEVSSPGINRPLVKESDFERFCGKDIKVRTRTPVGGQKNFKGAIARVADGRIEIQVAPERAVSIALKDIEKANLIGDLDLTRPSQQVS